MRGIKIKAALPALALTGTVLAVAVIAGCSLLRSAGVAGEVRIAFPHRPHIEDAELDCGTCHDWTADGSGRTSPDVCADCHDPQEEGATASQVRSLYEGGRPRGPFPARLSEEVHFDHQRHADGIDCAACHGDVAHGESIGSEVAVGMTRCLECHQDAGVSSDCATCHRSIRADQEPPSHAGNWLKIHGFDRRGADLDRCWLCHEQRGCEACHLNEMPQSHDNQFRTRGHGLLASMDRSSCATCHQSDFCVRCHREVEPASHIGSFGDPRNRHCAGCHLPVGSEAGCAVCHTATPSHDMAPPPPENTAHRTASDDDCRTCHTDLTHFDNGQSCRLCHQ